MTDNILYQFARHLHTCCQQELAQRPGPFRQVELSPPLLECEHDCIAVLVFWANKDSFFSGGVLLLPRTGSTTTAVNGQRIAQALGLSTYHTWDDAGIAAWPAETQQNPDALWSRKAPSAGMTAPDEFRTAVGQLLIDIQQRFFTEQHRLPRLSTSYLANLLQTAFVQIFEHLQVTNPRLADNPQQLSNSLLRRFMQILNLSAIGNLSVTTPEQLPEQLDAACGQLSPTLTASLVAAQDSTRFHEEAARRLHLLAVRLTQFGSELSPLILPTLECLIPVWANRLSQRPLPPAPPGVEPMLLLFPDHVPAGEPVAAEIGPTGMLAVTATWRQLVSDVSAPRQCHDPLLLVAPLAVGRVVGTLGATQRPAAAAVHALNARLRISWPNRNLALPASTPLWHWHLLHVIGLLPASAKLSLSLPGDWLTDSHAPALFALLTERFAPQNIAVQGDGWHQVTLAAASDSTTLCLRTEDGREKSLETGDTFPLDRLRLELLLPQPLAELVEQGDLRLYENGDLLPASAVDLFLHSTPGRMLWHLLQSRRALPHANRALSACCQHGIPLPRTQMLAALAKLATAKAPLNPRQVDREIADWLGPGCLSVAKKKASPLRNRSSMDDNHDTRIAAAATADGILMFPEDYLYNVPQTRRLHFEACDPLHIVENFFDTMTLETDDGDRLQVNGTATAHALVMATALGKRTMELPLDPATTEEILNRYILHLLHVRANLEKSVATLRGDNIMPTIDRIWKTLPVPPWALIKMHFPQVTEDMVECKNTSRPS